MQETRIPTPQSQSPSPSNFYPLSGFSISSALDREVPFTLLPTPLPEDRSSPLNEMHYTSSRTQGALAVIAACLHQSYDVRRAKMVFDDLRTSKQIIDVAVYNSFLRSFVDMARRDGGKEEENWIEQAWSLFAEMQTRILNSPSPDAPTIAAMFLIHVRFVFLCFSVLDLFLILIFVENRFDKCEDRFQAPSPSEILRYALGRQIDLASVVSDSIFDSSEDVEKVIKVLQNSAVEMGRMDVVTHLGAIRAQGEESFDPLEGVPEVRSVTASAKKVNHHSRSTSNCECSK